jgi:hypothetical protein
MGDIEKGDVAWRDESVSLLSIMISGRFSRYLGSAFRAHKVTRRQKLTF